MTTYRIRHSRDYFCLSRHAAQDVSISLRARGLHHLLLSFPDDWEINEKHIVKMAGIEKREAVRKAMKELMDAGYVVRSQQRNSGKFSKAAYDIFELPQPTVAQESDHGKTVDGGIGDGKTGDGNPNDIQSIDPQSIDQNKILTSTTRAKPRKEGGGSERVPLLDSEGSNAKEIAEWLCSEYWYHQMGSAEPLRFNCTRYLVDACKGHTKATARDAMLAFWEAMLGYVDINESINKPERFLAMRLKDREPLSAGNRERVLQYEQEVKARYHRKSAADYNRRWLAHAESAGILLDVRINEADQFYSFWYGDTGEPGNLNLWDLPPRYAHVTIDQLMKVPA